MSDEGLQLFPYPEEKSDLGDNEGLNCPPVGVSLTLPDSVVFFKTPQVARWDAAGSVSRYINHLKHGVKKSTNLGMHQSYSH